MTILRKHWDGILRQVDIPDLVQIAFLKYNPIAKWEYPEVESIYVPTLQRMEDIAPICTENDIAQAIVEKIQARRPNGANAFSVGHLAFAYTLDSKYKYLDVQTELKYPLSMTAYVPTLEFILQFYKIKPAILCESRYRREANGIN